MAPTRHLACFLSALSPRLQISRTDLYLIDQTDTTKNVDALEGTRDIVEESALEPEPFGFSGVRMSPQAHIHVSGVGRWSYTEI